MVRAAIGIGTLLSVAEGCDSATNPAIPIAIELQQSEITVVPGQAGPGPVRDPTVLVTFTIVRNGYDLDVPISVTAPAPIVITATTKIEPHDPNGVGFINIEAPAGTPAGDYRVVIRATARSRGSVEAELIVRVVPFRMYVYQPTLKVNQGGANTLSVYFTKDPKAAVTVTTSSAPGLTITPGASSALGVSHLDISTPADATPGPWTVTVTASSGGVTQSRDVEVVVQAPPPKREIAFRVCRSQVFGFLHFGGSYAYRNDGEGWRSVSLDQDDMVRFEATERVSFAERYFYNGQGYAYSNVTRVLYATASELEEMQCASANRGQKQFSVNASNAPSWHLTFGEFRGGFAGGTRPGPHDLIAVGSRTVPSGQEHVTIIRRGLDLPAGSTIALDFADAEAVTLDSATYEPAGASGTVYASTYLHTSTTIAAVRTFTTAKYWAIPEASLSDEDIQSVLFTAGGKGVLRYFRSAQSLTPTFGADLTTPTMHLEAQTLTLPSQPDYPDMAGVGYRRVFDDRGTYDLVEVWQTKAFLGGTPETWTFTPPDMGRIVAVPEIRADHAGVGAFAVGGKASLFFGGTPPTGTELRWASRSLGRFAWRLPFPSGR